MLDSIIPQSPLDERRTPVFTARRAFHGCEWLIVLCADSQAYYFRQAAARRFIGDLVRVSEMAKFQGAEHIEADIFLAGDCYAVTIDQFPYLIAIMNAVLDAHAAQFRAFRLAKRRALTQRMFQEDAS